MTPLFEYKGVKYPEYLRHGNAMQFIVPIAQQFCRGKGVDVGAGKWPFPGAVPIDVETEKWNVYALPEDLDYVFSSHCLEHLVDPVKALEHWYTRLKPGGVVFLYLPHPLQRYWQPANCRKHLHLFHPTDVATMIEDLGFVDVIHSERDLAWSFAVVGWKPRK